MDVTKSKKVNNCVSQDDLFDSISFQKILHYHDLWQGKSVYKLMCPVHQDVNASLLVDVSESNWFCFGCGTGGDPFDFYRFVNRLGEPTLKNLAGYLRALKSERVKKLNYVKYESSRHVKLDLEDGLDQAKHYFNSIPLPDWRTTTEADYLLNRGISRKTLHNCKAKLNYNSQYPYIFPIMDMGEFTGWVCRTDKPGIEAKRKYLYNEGFRRATTLAGRYDNHTVQLVEGYFDYLKSKQYGTKYVAAIMGWKVSDEQIEKLKKAGVKTIISALDNDPKGKEGTQYLKRYFEVIPFAFPPDIKDPGMMSKKDYDIAIQNTKINIPRRKRNGN